MKLFLTSTGLEDKDIARFFAMSFLPKEFKELSFLVVSIQDSEQDAFYLEKTLNEIKDTGVHNIDVFKLSDKKFVAKKGYDVVFVCGGNTFDYLDRIRKTGLEKFIIDFSKKDNSLYVGVSAGSVIAGPNIEIAGWGKEGDPNNINLQNLKGLGLTDFIIYPHYREELKAELDDFKRKTDYQIIELKDDQAVMLDHTSPRNLKNKLNFKTFFHHNQKRKNS